MKITPRPSARVAILSGVMALLPVGPTAVQAAALADAGTEADAAGWSAGLITVTASRADVLDIGGAVTVLDTAALERFSYGDANRLLRQVPGVFLQEEDGFGLRPNIGIRGSGTDRSARVAIMEDGILIAPAPYAAPAAYYFPRMARMAGVEVAKGPAAIKYGPMTVGGAINFFSTPLPDTAPGKVTLRADLLAGSYDGYRALGSVGGWAPLGGGIEVGGMVEGLYEHSSGFKAIDRGGDTGFEIADIVAKVGLRSTDGRHQLVFKFQDYDEASNETYLGLTLDDFAATPNRRYNASQRDVMDVSHRTYQLTHDWTISDAVRVTTTAYRNDTARAWYKLNDIRNTANTGWVGIGDVLLAPAANPIQFAELVGADGFTGRAGSLRVRNNNRVYQATGIQSALAAKFDTGGVSHDLEVSARYHEDSEDRFQQDDLYQMVDGTMVLTRAGAPGSQDNRKGDARALALYARDTIDFGDLTLVPGLRYEKIRLRQTRWALGDAARATPANVTESTIDVWLPGLAATWRLADDVRLIAGAHRGFASPAPGSNVAAETSWNYEAGVRLGSNGWRAEIIGFFNDYSNLVGTCTASSGGDCQIGDQFAGGAVDVRGIEVAANTVLGSITQNGFEMPVGLVYTYTKGNFQTGFASSYGPWGTVAIGDELPYLPAHQLTLNVGLSIDRLRLDTALNFVSKTRATAGAGAIAANDRIDDRALVDVSANFDLVPGVALFATVQNVFDVAYNASFSPDGARPGTPRLAMAGVKLRF